MSFFSYTNFKVIISILIYGWHILQGLKAVSLTLYQQFRWIKISLTPNKRFLFFLLEIGVLSAYLGLKALNR